MTLSVPRSTENFTYAIFPLPGAGAAASLSLVPEAVSVGVNVVLIDILSNAYRAGSNHVGRFAEVAPRLKSPVQTPGPSLDDQIALLEQEAARLERSTDPTDRDLARILRGAVGALQVILGQSSPDHAVSENPNIIVNSADPTGSAAVADTSGIYKRYDAFLVRTSRVAPKAKDRRAIGDVMREQEREARRLAKNGSGDVASLMCRFLAEYARVVLHDETTAREFDLNAILYQRAAAVAGLRPDFSQLIQEGADILQAYVDTAAVANRDALENAERVSKGKTERAAHGAARERVFAEIRALPDGYFKSERMLLLWATALAQREPNVDLRTIVRSISLLRKDDTGKSLHRLEMSLFGNTLK